MANAKPTVILDFDGTVADSFAMAVDIAQTLLKQYGYEPWTAKQIAELRELSASQILRRVKVSPRHLPGLVRQVRKEQKSRIHIVAPIKGIEDVLRDLSRDYTLAIISSSDSDLIEHFLAKYQMSKYVSTVMGGAGLLSKNRNIKKFIKTRALSNDSVVYVGDEVPDIHAARRSKIEVVSVTWCFN